MINWHERFGPVCDAFINGYRHGCAHHRDCPNPFHEQIDQHHAWNYGFNVGYNAFGEWVAAPPAQSTDADKAQHSHTHVPDVERVRQGHSYMTAQAFTDGSVIGHRMYAQSHDEGCYLCALLAEIDRLRADFESRAAVPEDMVLVPKENSNLL